MTQRRRGRARGFALRLRRGLRLGDERLAMRRAFLGLPGCEGGEGGSGGRPARPAARRGVGLGIVWKGLRPGLPAHRRQRRWRRRRTGACGRGHDRTQRIQVERLAGRRRGWSASQRRERAWTRWSPATPRSPIGAATARANCRPKPASGPSVPAELFGDGRSLAPARESAREIRTDQRGHGLVAARARTAAENDGHDVAVLCLRVRHEVEPGGAGEACLDAVNPSTRPRSLLWF